MVGLFVFPNKNCTLVRVLRIDRSGGFHVLLLICHSTRIRGKLRDGNRRDSTFQVADFGFGGSRYNALFPPVNSFHSNTATARKVGARQKLETNLKM